MHCSDIPTPPTLSPIFPSPHLHRLSTGICQFRGGRWWQCNRQEPRSGRDSVPTPLSRELRGSLICSHNPSNCHQRSVLLQIFVDWQFWNCGITRHCVGHSLGENQVPLSTKCGITRHCVGHSLEKNQVPLSTKCGITRHCIGHSLGEKIRFLCTRVCMKSGVSWQTVLSTGEPVDKLYSCSKAAVVRDAAAKALYSRMFQWIVSRINTHLQPRDNYSRSKLSVTEDHLNIGIVHNYIYQMPIHFWRAKQTSKSYTFKFKATFKSCVCSNSCMCPGSLYKLVMPEREVAVCSADEGQQARNSCPELPIFFLLESHGIFYMCIVVAISCTYYGEKVRNSDD